MRGVLEEQLAALAWGETPRRDPGKAKILRALLRVGFSPSLSRQLLDKLPAGRTPDQSLKWANAALAHNLHTAPRDDIIDHGGVYALVGPTGVGKTTTTAKLAARCVVRHGADKVALLTTDSYRIGGHEQLRIYGKLLGVPVRSVKDTDDLQLILAELRGKHMVLIDTVGVGQRDQMVAEQVAMLCNCGSDVKRLLLLNATGSGDTLDEVVQAYQGSGLGGCIITKVDEAVSLGAVLDALIRRKLVLHYVANGQKVPEDLHAADSRHLLDSALQPTQENSPFALQDAESALVMAASTRLANAADLNGSVWPRNRLSAGADHG
jgi:flagellar biosynthesis protein FlhF